MLNRILSHATLIENQVLVIIISFLYRIDHKTHTKKSSMTFYFPPWNNALEPSQGNVRQWLDNLYSKFQPIEQSRWNQSNIDTMFYAGAQTFVNRVPAPSLK